MRALEVKVYQVIDAHMIRIVSMNVRNSIVNLYSIDREYIISCLDHIAFVCWPTSRHLCLFCGLCIITSVKNAWNCVWRRIVAVMLFLRGKIPHGVIARMKHRTFGMDQDGAYRDDVDGCRVNLTQHQPNTCLCVERESEKK
jgi:hypothetical protein